MIELMKKILTGAKIEDKEREYAIYFYASSQVTLIRKWVLDNYEISPRQLAVYYKNGLLMQYVIVICLEKYFVNRIINEVTL